MSDVADTRRLVVAITEFLKNQLDERLDFAAEDRDSIRIAIECLELAYGLEERDPRRRQVRRPLLEIFNQGTNPPSVKDKIRAETLKNEGNDKMSQGLHEEALDCYSQAIELDRWNAIYYCNRAGANIELGRHYDALADCREALSLNPDYTKAFSRMGQTYTLMERPERAARCYRQALELEPDNERYRNNLQAAESSAASAPRGDAFLENLLSSFLGPGMSSGGSSITIITEITPREEDGLDGESNLDNETTQPGETPMQDPFGGVMGLALPLFFGLMAADLALSSDSSGEATEADASVQEIVDELVESVSEVTPDTRNMTNTKQPSTSAEPQATANEHKAKINPNQATEKEHKATQNEQRATQNQHQATQNQQQATQNQQQATQEQQATQNQQQAIQNQQQTIQNQQQATQKFQQAKTNV